ncbi:M3 family metallopeptidase [Prochlorococcus marinus]|uniref:M3 family metallopeptidase n=1 Tax=Prochlorococcus marinus TaxID=1219 RepID=UPI0007B3CB32|nr:M3 family metallopeptidase [Prochlorococcus marinus]KZR77937.1 Oligopeptidase A [Prochlorococcus marinus str. MIT 1320]
MPVAVNEIKSSALLQGEGIPNFTAITAQQVQDHMPELLCALNKQFSRLEQDLDKVLVSGKSINWEQVMSPLHRLQEQLRWSWGVVSHLNGVCNTSELRQAHAAQEPEVVRFGNLMGQSQTLHRALRRLKDQTSRPLLDSTQQRILNAELLSMDQRGVGLDDDAQQAFNTTSEQLAELSTRFSNHVLDATQGWSLLLNRSAQVEGLPQRALEVLSLAAKQAGDHREDGGEPTAEQGPWRLGLDMPRYIPFITHAKDRGLRETLYKAQVSRASAGELNNQPLIEELLSLRLEQAQRLGYRNWAELSLASKMAEGVEAVEQLLDELRAAALPAAQKELIELEACAKKHGAPEASQLKPWDVNFWAERLRQERFDLDQEALRPWFPMPQVLKGLFGLCERLFGIRIQSADGEAPIWHQDVRFFRVLDANGSDLAAFYLDPYSRPASKRGGAWMDECLTRSKSLEGQSILPVAYLICNQTPPQAETPSLMSFDEVETLFHEFGHGLQHMLTTVEYPQAAGINNVEWDAVELPSQFMENWCLDRTTLMGMARHWRTGEPLPEEEFAKLRSSRTFNAGLATLRQVHFALTDLRLHSCWTPDLGVTPDQLRRQIAQTTTVMLPIAEDQFLCSFGHIFAGGYSAGYYSYKWAEVLSADAFAAFEEAGLELEDQVRLTGARFRDTVLSLGGSHSPADVYEQFRGRPATTEALIRHSGLVASAADQ